MKEIPLSKTGKNKGKYVALVDDDTYEYLSQWNWYVHIVKRERYAARQMPRKSNRRKKIYMHHLVCEPRPTVDHIDGNGLNNQRGNLRPATHLQNHMNQRKELKNTTGFKNVVKVNEINQYKVVLCKNYKRIYLGCFKSKIDAAVCADLWAKDLFGEFANLNFKER